MEVKIDFIERELNFEAGENRGSSIGEFVLFLRDNNDRIKSISVTGESTSYTFKRQVYLLLNLMNKYYGCVISINSKKVGDSQLIPTY